MLCSRMGGVHLHPASGGVIGAKTPQKAGFRFAQQASPLCVIIRCGLLKTIPIYENNYKIYSSKDAFLFLPLQNDLQKCVCTHTRFSTLFKNDPIIILIRLCKTNK